MIIETKELSIKEIPRFNEIGFFPSDAWTNTQPFSYVALIKLITKTPEAIGIISAIVTDILSDGYTFEGPKSKVAPAEKFLSENRFKTEFKSCLLDWLMMGNSALWKGKISKGQSKEFYEKLSNIEGIEIKETELKEIIDEEANKTKSLKCAPWSTMNIEMNEQKTMVTGYHQIVAGEKTTQFTPDEIIHGKFMQFDGRVYGFSPMEASINVLTTLSLIKDVNGNFFQNGGVPDWMFILAKEMAGSPQVKKLEQTLRKYKSSRLKHGNLVFTGEVNPVQMNKIGEKDMDFRMLSIYYTGILALAFNMPLARVAAILGMEAKQSASGTDLSEAGYWRSISASQDYWEDLLNQQLFVPEFGVKIKFNRGYLNDQIKEAQRDVQMFQVIDQLIQREAVTKEYAKLKLHIPDRFWTGKWKMPEPEIASPFGGSSGSPGSPPKNSQKGTAGQARVQQKKNEATKATERKEINNHEVNEVEFDNLVNDFVKKSEMRKINWYIQDGKYNFSMDTPESSYSYSIPVDEISSVKRQEWISHGRNIKPPLEKQKLKNELDTIREQKQKIVDSIVSSATREIDKNKEKSVEEIEKNKTKLKKVIDKVDKEKESLSTVQKIRDKVKKEMVENIQSAK